MSFNQLIELPDLSDRAKWSPRQASPEHRVEGKRSRTQYDQPREQRKCCAAWAKGDRSVTANEQYECDGPGEEAGSEQERHDTVQRCFHAGRSMQSGAGYAALIALRHGHDLMHEHDLSEPDASGKKKPRHAKRAYFGRDADQVIEGVREHKAPFRAKHHGEWSGDASLTSADNAARWPSRVRP